MTKEGESGEMRKVKDNADKLILRLGVEVRELVTLIRTQSNQGLGMRAGHDVVTCLNRMQFETRRFQFRSSLSGRPWKVGTTGFKLHAV
jgi:hypothetical protein